MSSLKSLFRSTSQGFTLVELMAAIAIMAILAAVSAPGMLGLVPGYQKRACEKERNQAVRVFVSNWLETRRLTGDDGDRKSASESWLSSYLKTYQVNCGKAAESWNILLEEEQTGFQVTIFCRIHKGSDAAATLGQTTDPAGGIGWDGGFLHTPSLTAPLSSETHFQSPAPSYISPQSFSTQEYPPPPKAVRAARH